MSFNEELQKILLSGGPNDLENISAARKLLIQHKVGANSDYAEALTWVFPLLLQTLKDTTGTGPLRVTCSDTLAICLLRVSQLVAASPDFAIHFKAVLLEQGRLDVLFSYIVDYWDESGAPLSNSLKDVFSKLVSLLKKYDFNQEVFQQWVDTALKIKKERRVLYYLIETLSKELENHQYIIHRDPNIIQDSLKLIGSPPLGNLIGKSNAAILQKLYTNEEEADLWISNYWGPIKSAIQDPTLRQGVVSHLLPHLFKTSEAAFRSIVKEFQDDVEIFITFLNIGQQLTIEEDPYPNLVDRSTIERLLTHNDYKIKVFQILTFSAKGSRSINPEVFEILKGNLELFFVDADVETRNEFISLFKQFSYRMKDSGYALNRDAAKLIAKNKFLDEANEKLAIVKTYKDFTIALFDLIKSQLVPGSQYQRVIAGLKILKHLVESNLDPNIYFKVEINHAFQIPLLNDEELVRLLFNNVLSTYDDIREISSYLLILSAPSISEVEKTHLLDSSFKLLNDYGKSDSGAKFLQLCHSLFKDDSIYTRLLEDIPLMSDIKQAVNHPVDGYFQALTLLLPQLHDKSVLQPLKVLQIVEMNWNTVKEILINDSPEGCDQYGVGSAQLVLSYGWRSTKESTLLLTKLLESSKFSDDDLINIGELTLDQLSSVRHRGAFSSVYPTFIKLASICSKQIPGQNKKWLDFNISLIQTRTQLITRRSGGLPYLITAILTVERDLFEYAFDKLIKMAKEPVNETEESEKMDIAQVHAFNCIKTLFIESQLSNSCAPHIYEALSLTLSTFSSKIWSVRNCSIMLFTALQNRLFGYKRMSARVFFARFKGLKEILIDILRDSSTGKIENLETLFPVLTILSKVHSTPGYNGLSEFQPLLRACLATKHWKIRECASRALPALVPFFKDEALLLVDTCSIKEQNKLHGHLLAINKLLEYIDLSGELDCLSAVLVERSVELLVLNPSYVTRTAYLEVLRSISSKNKSLINSELSDFLKELFIQDNEVYDLDGSKQLYLKSLFSLIMINHEDEEALLNIGLNSKFFEVKLQSIQYCSNRNIKNENLLSIAKDDNEWIYTRSKAIPLVSDISIDEAFDFVQKQNVYGEDIKCAGLRLLGTLVSQTNSEVFLRWIDILRVNLGDDEPFPVRMAALRSALNYLGLKNSSTVEFLVYKTLSDDDDEIRELASDYFSKGTVPWITAKRFSENFGNDFETSKNIVNEIMGTKFNPPADTSSDQVLFTVEKRNFYINKIEQTRQLSKMLSNSWDHIDEKTKENITTHIETLFEQAIFFLKTIGTDDILGWSNNEYIFDELYSVFYLKKKHGSKERVDIPEVNLHRTLQNLLE